MQHKAKEPFNTHGANHDLTTLTHPAPIILFFSNHEGILINLEGKSIIDLYGHLDWLINGVSKLHKTGAPTKTRGEIQNRHYEAYLYPYLSVKRDTSQISGVAIDITEFARSRENLIGTLLHDLINPLTAISVNSSLLNRIPIDRLDSKTLTKIANNIETSVEQIKSVVKTSLTH